MKHLKIFLTLFLFSAFIFVPKAQADILSEPITKISNSSWYDEHIVLIHNIESMLNTDNCNGFSSACAFYNSIDEYLPVIDNPLTNNSYVNIKMYNNVLGVTLYNYYTSSYHQIYLEGKVKGAFRVWYDENYNITDVKHYTPSFGSVIDPSDSDPINSTTVLADTNSIYQSQYQVYDNYTDTLDFMYLTTGFFLNTNSVKNNQTEIYFRHKNDIFPNDHFIPMQVGDLVLDYLTNSNVVTSVFVSKITTSYEEPNVPSISDINDNIIQTNEKLDSILDTSSPDLGGLNNSNTWLPQGPVDSIIMLPLNFINTLTSKIGSSCSSINLPIPFLENKFLVLPCVSTLFEQINGFSTLYDLIGVIGSVYLLYNYLLRFYKWIDDTLSFRENNWQDWGGD